jgi:phage shock protein PspC (stress-responsive transcriptional regulator)
MSDIESRIAELFLEKRANELQVISIQHVENVIDIMGQPEDYEVDEEIFEEQTSQKKYQNSSKNKQLFRDTQNGYIGGVSGGIGYFIGIDALWVRILWVLLVFFSVGWAIPVYILLWILVPDAVTTNQRLTMMGKEVNISNIEENFKQGFDPVVDGQTDASHHTLGQKGKRGSVAFFSFLGKLIKGILKVLAKVIGLIVFIAAITGLIGLIVSSITASFVNFYGKNTIGFFDIALPDSHSPWFVFIALIFAAGIPLFILAILGLKLLVNNLRSIGMPAKIVLVILWIIAVIVLSITGVQIAANQVFEGNAVKVEEFEIDTSKVFHLELSKENDLKDQTYVNINGFNVTDYKGEKALQIKKIKIAISKSKDNMAYVKLDHYAKGDSFDSAKYNAESLIYDFKLTDSTFKAPNYFIAPRGTGITGQRLSVTIYLPENTQLKMNKAFQNIYRHRIEDDIFNPGMNKNYMYEITNDKVICIDCPNKNTIEGNEPAQIDGNNRVINSNNTDEQGVWRYEENEE